MTEHQQPCILGETFQHLRMPRTSSAPWLTRGRCTQGAKISTLTAAVDDRVRALCLWDPVDVTVYAPQSAEYPSAVAALRSARSSLPVAVVGGGKAGDCVPKNSNYRCPG